MMAVPARAAADSQEPSVPRPDPRAPGWADVRRLMITDSHAVALAAAEVAARPGDEAALAMLELTRQVMESAVEMGRRLVFDETGMQAREREAYEQGVADCMAARCRLELIQGGKDG